VRQDGPHYAFGNAICQPKQILDLSVVGVSPNLGIRLRVKQTNNDAQAIACLGETAG
jgi:hypothetical protein